MKKHKGYTLEELKAAYEGHSWRHSWHYALMRAVLHPGERIAYTGKLKQIKKLLMKQKIPCRIEDRAIYFPNGAVIKRT